MLGFLFAFNARSFESLENLFCLFFKEQKENVPFIVRNPHARELWNNFIAAYFINVEFFNDYVLEGRSLSFSESLFFFLPFAFGESTMST